MRCFGTSRAMFMNIKRANLNLGRGRYGTSWTKEEDRKLRDSYTTLGHWKQLRQQFPGRTERAIRARARRLGLHRPDYSPRICPKCGREKAAMARQCQACWRVALVSGKELRVRAEIGAESGAPPTLREQVLGSVSRWELRVIQFLDPPGDLALCQMLLPRRRLWQIRILMECCGIEARELAE